MLDQLCQTKGCSSWNTLCISVVKSIFSHSLLEMLWECHTYKFGRRSQSRWRLGRGGCSFFFFSSFLFLIVSLMSLFIFYFFLIKKLTLCICAITTCHENGQTLEMPRLLTQHKMNSNRKWCTFSWELFFFFLNNKLSFYPSVLWCLTFLAVFYIFSVTH